MMLQSRLLEETVQLTPDAQVLFLNSAADPFVAVVAQLLHGGSITLAEDNIAALPNTGQFRVPVRHVPFHEYIALASPMKMDVAILNLLYQPGSAWTKYALEVAAYALKEDERLYVVGAKDRGILSLAKRMQARFGNVETLEISKGHRVVCSRNIPASRQAPTAEVTTFPMSTVFAQGKIDEGTQLLMDALEVRVTDVALDIGCGAGHLGLHIAHLAPEGNVTMVDASLAAVAAASEHIQESGLHTFQVLASDGAQAVMSQRFDLVVTNPPFHPGGIQTTATAERFIREAAQVLRPSGRFYLVANRFLKYEPTLRECFRLVEEVRGNTRYKVLLGKK